MSLKISKKVLLNFPWTKNYFNFLGGSTSSGSIWKTYLDLQDVRFDCKSVEPVLRSDQLGLKVFLILRDALNFASFFSAGRQHCGSIPFYSVQSAGRKLSVYT